MFWVIYKNLEKEIIELSNKLHFCDAQENVYSIYISDLLVRASVEIEALSKELYKLSGGNMNPVGLDGKARVLMFDSDCLQYLDVNWGITKRVVNIVCPNFDFQKSENLILRPLKDCNKQGKGRWKKAYQAVKHDRVGSLNAGNIGNLIRAMAALYILNVYYRNESYIVGSMMQVNPFDTRMGSDLFSLSLVQAEHYNFDSLKFEGLSDEDFKSATLIQKYTEESFSTLLKSLNMFKDEVQEKLSKSPLAQEFLSRNPNYKFKGYLHLIEDIGGEKLLNEIMKNQSIVSEMKKSQIEVVLNKGQNIYQINNSI